jgi:hypothetical protein
MGETRASRRSLWQHRCFIWMLWPVRFRFLDWRKEGIQQSLLDLDVSGELFTMSTLNRRTDGQKQRSEPGAQGNNHRMPNEFCTSRWIPAEWTFQGWSCPWTVRYSFYQFQNWQSSTIRLWLVTPPRSIIPSHHPSCDVEVMLLLCYSGSSRASLHM